MRKDEQVIRLYAAPVRRRRMFAGGVLAFMALVLPAAPAQADGRVPDRLWQAYAAAIADSAVSRPGEVVNDLVVASPQDPRTQWTTIDGEPHMLVARLGFRAISSVAAGEPFTTTSHVFTFVPQELKERCAELNCAQLSDRKLDFTLKQLIGLPPDADYTVMSRVWVKPADLFRPCTQVDPLMPTCPQQVANTIHAGVDRSTFLFEQGMYSWRVQRTGSEAPISCAKDFTNTAGGNCLGFPWTRLGYTYNWSPGARSERGLTEFVIAPGSQVVLESAGAARDLIDVTAS